MSVVDDVLKTAASRIGYYAPKDPNPGSEAGRYWAQKTGQKWLQGPSTSIWWCMLFVSMVLDMNGQIDAIGGFSYNTDITLGRNRNRLVGLANARPGDIVIFNWDGGGTDHVGFVEKNLGNGVLQTIEGNTSSGAAGSQSAGNGVWRRRRSSSIAAIIRPAYTGSVTITPTTHKIDVGLVVDGIFGVNTIKRLQSVLDTPVDGLISSQYSGNRKYVPAAGSGWLWSVNPVGSQAVAALQRKLGVEDDGIIGPTTIKALQRYLGVEADGYCGSITVSALQARLNAGTF